MAKDWDRWCWNNSHEQLVALLRHQARENQRIYDMGQQSEEKVNAADWPSYRQMARAEQLLADAVASLSYPNVDA